MENDNFFLKRAIEIAGKGIGKGGGPFGAVVVGNGKIISETFNKVVLSHDPTAHAEILAIRMAAEILQTHDLNDCTIYTSCEPCPMCLGAIYWSGIRKVVYAYDRTDAASAGFSDNMIYQEIALDPSERKIKFLRINDMGGKEVFRQWNQMENKIPY